MLTYAQAADLLAIPIGTLYAWVHQRRIPHHRLSGRMVRFDRGELQGWLEGHRVGALPTRA